MRENEDSSDCRRDVRNAIPSHALWQTREVAAAFVPCAATLSSWLISSLFCSNAWCTLVKKNVSYLTEKCNKLIPCRGHFQTIFKIDFRNCSGHQFCWRPDQCAMASSYGIALKKVVEESWNAFRTQQRLRFVAEEKEDWHRYMWR